jgi:hypothetical protein
MSAPLFPSVEAMVDFGAPIPPAYVAATRGFIAMYDGA